jgi:hypothetical protein
MKFSDSDLSMWAREVVLVLRAAEVPVIDHAAPGRVELRTTAGGIVTAWASGKVSAGGPEEARDDALAVLASKDFVVGWKPGVTGGMLVGRPKAPQPSQVKVAPALFSDLSALRREVWGRVYAAEYLRNGPPVPGEDAKLRAKSAAAAADLAVAHMPTPAHLEG